MWVHHCILTVSVQNLAAVAILINVGADVNERDSDGSTPLHIQQYSVTITVYSFMLVVILYYT